MSGSDAVVGRTSPRPVTFAPVPDDAATVSWKVLQEFAAS